MSRYALALALFAIAQASRADTLDDFIKAQMQKYEVPGLSLAIIQDGKIVKAQGYGVTDKQSKTPVTTTTLFQAGSISKSVAAVGALRLVEQGKLVLDENVNNRLKTWKVPDNKFTRESKVTLRGILSHTAGLTVHGFPGYAVTEKAPSLVEILDGKKPSNTPAIRVDTVPGTTWRYSGGGYTIMQQLMLDMTGKSFPELLQESVLTPFGMTNSTFEQPLPSDKASKTASGYYSDEKLVPGRWHIYPEMAAAGLWTTASDLATFAIGIQQSLAGKSNPVISQTMTRQMLTEQKNADGLGVFLEGKGDSARFSHGGRDEGFDATLVAYEKTGQGAAIMINANNNTRVLSRIVEAIAKEYKWPEYPTQPTYQAIEDKEPLVTKLLKNVMTGLTAGKFDKELFTPELSERIAAVLKSGVPEQLKRLGQMESMTLVERKNMGNDRFYRYRLNYNGAILLMPCTFNKENKISMFSIEPE
jgi:CubicO group peptidase (beta-lactamase class C family)